MTPDASKRPLRRVTDGAHAIGLAEWLQRRSRRMPQRPALTFEGVTWTYAQLQERIERFSAVLALGGVKRGDRVAYLGFNHPAFAVAMFATARLGAIFVPLNFRLTGPEVQFIIQDAGAITLIAGKEHLSLSDGIRGALPCRHYLSVEDAAPAGWESMSRLMRESPEVPAGVEADPDEVALIMYTSGTTGHPKGAMLTHANLWTNNVNALLTMEFGSDDVGLVFAPLFHIGGLAVIPLPLWMMGGHVVLQGAFEPGEALRAIEQHRVTVGFAVPAMLLFMSQNEAYTRSDLSSLRIMTVGGAPVPEALLRLYNGRGIPVHQGYGMTETAPTITFLAPERAADKLGSCGTAPPLTEFRLRGFDGDVIAQPQVMGEVCVRGGNVMRGYWNRPDATDAAFDDDGFFRTGDAGYVDEEGFLFLCDRVKDMIISGGENVYPAEVESVLYEHPAIAEVAVIGAPDERWGERVVAVAALKSGASLSLEQLQGFAEKKLARYKLPGELRLVPVLPRNASGKVLKAQLRGKPS